ncbi:hypothetical protein E2C01_083467 [Portunus trituberculatus]|uniref:Uncharacterized protein n=1 Tax=Portunus trituberculatus TaxID=210409 RepID=A0A5B7J4R6_PORTR|nr:hypothetical protein [Portunus trituberculatus]
MKIAAEDNKRCNIVVMRKRLETLRKEEFDKTKSLHTCEEYSKRMTAFTSVSTHSSQHHYDHPRKGIVTLRVPWYTSPEVL